MHRPRFHFSRCTVSGISAQCPLGSYLHSVENNLIRKRLAPLSGDCLLQVNTGGEIFQEGRFARRITLRLQREGFAGGRVPQALPAPGSAAAIVLCQGPGTGLLAPSALAQLVQLLREGGVLLVTACSPLSLLPLRLLRPVPGVVPAKMRCRLQAAQLQVCGVDFGAHLPFPFAAGIAKRLMPGTGLPFGALYLMVAEKRRLPVEPLSQGASQYFWPLGDRYPAPHHRLRQWHWSGTARPWKIAA